MAIRVSTRWKAGPSLRPSMVASRPLRRSARSWGRVIFLQGLGHQRLEARYPVCIRRMVGQELGRLARAGFGLHPLPEADRLARVVAGTRHQREADLVGLIFLLAGERHQEPVSGA